MQLAERIDNCLLKLSAEMVKPNPDFRTVIANVLMNAMHDAVESQTTVNARLAQR